MVAASTKQWSAHSELMIDEAEGQLLRLLVALTGARRIVEIGTFAGYSALAMAEAMPHDGRIDTLELSPEHAAKAQRAYRGRGRTERITIHVGIALDSLEALEGPTTWPSSTPTSRPTPPIFEVLLSRDAQRGPDRG